MSCTVSGRAQYRQSRPVVSVAVCVLRCCAIAPSLQQKPHKLIATYRASISLLSPLAAASKEEELLNFLNIKDKIAKGLVTMRSGDAEAESEEAKGGEEIIFARGQLSD